MPCVDAKKFFDAYYITKPTSDARKASPKKGKK